MMTLQGIAAEALPPHQFGGYLRDHLSDRYRQMCWEMVRTAVQAFNPKMPEHTVREWFDQNMAARDEHWETQVFPAIMRSLEENAQYYVEAHRKDSQSHKEEEE